MSSAQHPAPAGRIVIIAAQPWHGVESTERALALALAEEGPVLWVDPPVTATVWLRGRAGAPLGRSEVAEGITRLRLLAPPFAFRQGVSDWVRRHRARVIGRRIARMPAEAVLLFTPRDDFPAGPARRVLYVTDDWPEGAALMGVSRSDVERMLASRIADADLVTAVSPDLADGLRRYGRPVAVVPNGVRTIPSDDTADEGNAVLVGQLNERVDPAILDALVAARIPLLLIGPRSDRDPRMQEAWDRTIAAETVTWLGAMPVEQLTGHLQAARVGLTPYADTPFNRASFPLKTLEYLAAGIRAVSTDLPAMRWLDTDLIEIAASADDFASRVASAMASPVPPEERARRRREASGHSWRMRAAEVRKLVHTPDAE